MAMNPTQKETRKWLIKNLGKAYGIVRAYRNLNITVLVVPVTQDNNSVFYRVSVAYCGANDKFKRKRGEFEALCHWYYDGNYITVPSFGMTVGKFADYFATVYGVADKNMVNLYPRQEKPDFSYD